jgi:CheY-like chemotaxis protein
MEETRQQRTIMVVDDDPIGLKLVTAILGEAGFGTVTAADGRQCLDGAAGSGADLILMDISMPIMDGIAACRELKKNPELEPIPVVFVTANADDDTLASAFDAGGSDYVRKPINRIELLARVRSALVQREAIEKQAEKEKLKAALETTGGVCHKLNQPLQYVLGAVQILMMDLGPEDPKFAQLDKVREKVEQMGQITAKMAKITQYHTQAHAGGQNILDIDKCVQNSSDKK